MPEPEERYSAVDLTVLEAIKELAWIRDVDWQLLPAIRLTLRVAHIDQHGRLVVAGWMVRDLTPK